MGGETRWLRARAVAGEWFVPLVVAFAVLAAAGGYAAGTAHVAPGTTTEQRTVEHWSVAGEFEHSATVTRENPIFDTGETLEDRSTYFVDVSPVLDAEYTVSYSDPTGDAEPVDLAATATLVLDSSNEDVTYWTDRQPLASATSALDPGETETLAFDLNASRIEQRATEIQDGLGDTTGDVTATVEIAVNGTGAVAGSEYPVSFTQSVPLSIGGSTYGVGETQSGSDAATTTRTVQVAQSYGPLWTVGGPLLLVVGLAGLGALGAAYRRDALGLTEAEREYLAYRDDRAEFDEWVVRARLPPAVHERERADAESLSDLVDYAIDADAGVVEDTDSGTYYVVTRDLVVTFDPPAEPETPSPFADASDGDDAAAPGALESGDGARTTAFPDDDLVHAVEPIRPEREFDLGDGSNPGNASDSGTDSDSGDGSDPAAASDPDDDSNPADPPRAEPED
jgi:hypothetical protein